MKLQIYLLDDYLYQASKPSVPFVGMISSEVEIELAEKVDVNEITLTNNKDQNIWFGYRKHILGNPRDTFLLTNDRPYFVLCNVFERIDDAPNFIPGSYELYLRVAVFKKHGEKFERIKLEAKKQVTFEDN
jgi:hypothetical protein